MWQKALIKIVSVPLRSIYLRMNEKRSSGSSNWSTLSFILDAPDVQFSQKLNIGAQLANEHCAISHCITQIGLFYSTSLHEMCWAHDEVSRLWLGSVVQVRVTWTPPQLSLCMTCDKRKLYLKIIVFLVSLKMPDLAALLKLIVRCCELLYLLPDTQISLLDWTLGGLDTKCFEKLYYSTRRLLSSELCC